jgi:hypothetical protein
MVGDHSVSDDHQSVRCHRPPRCDSSCFVSVNRSYSDDKRHFCRRRDESRTNISVGFPGAAFLLLTAGKWPLRVAVRFLTAQSGGSPAPACAVMPVRLSGHAPYLSDKIVGANSGHVTELSRSEGDGPPWEGQTETRRNARTSGERGARTRGTAPRLIETSRACSRPETVVEASALNSRGCSARSARQQRAIAARRPVRVQDSGEDSELAGATFTARARRRSRTRIIETRRKRGAAQHRGVESRPGLGRTIDCAVEQERDGFRFDRQRRQSRRGKGADAREP